MDPDTMADAANATMTFGAKFVGLVQELTRPFNEKRLNKARIKALEEYSQFHDKHPSLPFSCDENGLHITVGETTAGQDHATETEKTLGNVLISGAESRRAENTAAVIREASMEIPFEQEVSNEPVDETWLLRFVEQASYATADSIRSIWAKLLAEEVSHPGACSIRTMETLGQLDTREAQLFSKAMQYVARATSHLYISDDRLSPLLTYEEIVTLQDAGLLASNEGTSLTTPPNESGVICIFTGSYLLRINTKQHNKIEQSVMLLSAAGKELYELLGTRSTLEAAKAYAEVLIQKSEIKSIDIHVITNVDDESGEFTYKTNPEATVE